jgi:hypothetical protein
VKIPIDLSSLVCQAVMEEVILVVRSEEDMIANTPSRPLSRDIIHHLVHVDALCDRKGTEIGINIINLRIPQYNVPILETTCLSNQIQTKSQGLLTDRDQAASGELPLLWLRNGSRVF